MATIQQAEQLVGVIRSAREARLRVQQRAPASRKYLHLSNLNSCERRDVLDIQYTDQLPPPDLDLVARFEAGHRIHNEVAAELMRLEGIEIRHEPSTFDLEDKTHRLVARGRVDGFIRATGDGNGKRRTDWFPYDIKSSKYLGGVHDAEGLKSGSPWLLRIYRQMQSYLLCYGHETGLFIFTDGLGSFDFVPVLIDYDCAEWVLSHCERVMDFVELGELPPFHHDKTECLRCPHFKRLCQPPVNADECGVWSDDEAMADLSTIREHAAAAKAYSRAEGRIKKRAQAELGDKANLDIWAGDALIACRKGERKMQAKGAHVQTVRYVDIAFPGSDDDE